MIFVTFPNVDYQAVVLTHELVKDRLLSYSFLKDLPDEFLKEYVENGYVEKEK